MNNFTLSIITSFLTSFGICLLLVKFRHRHTYLSASQKVGVQDVHYGDVPRIGGVGIFIGLWVAWELAPPALAVFMCPLLVPMCLVFLIGFIEDITGKVSVSLRFSICFVAALLAIHLTGVSIKQLGIPYVDSFLGTEWGSYLFTAFAITGIVNAINIIDGFNGLTSSVVIVVSLTFAYLAFIDADSIMFKYNLLIVSVALGFMLVNYPKGVLFLGDGGAYVLGFLVAWSAIMVPHHSGPVSNWASLMVLSYPVIEVLFTIYRRVSQHKSPGHPDSLHLHSLIYSQITCKWLSTQAAYLKNAMVVILLLPYILISQILVLMFYDEKLSLIASFLVCVLVYNLLYRRLSCFKSLKLKCFFCTLLK